MGNDIRLRYVVYITTTRKNTALYIGVTSDLARRIQQHQGGGARSFTGRYNATKLVYYEEHDSIHAAMMREKQLKNWRREWKVDLIRSVNPEFRDLTMDFGFGL